MDTLTACHWGRTREFCGSLPRLLLFRRDDYRQVFEETRKSRDSITDSLLSLPGLRSARETLAGIVWLNVAAHIGVRFTVAVRVTHDLLNWEQSFVARWTPGWLREAARKKSMREFVTRAVRSCLTPWTLTKSSLMPSKWHTWITNAFVHVDALHLLSNMVGLWKLGLVVGGLPGVTAIDILCITVGASISGSAALLIVSHNVPASFIGCGASAVVYAISVAATLGAPLQTLKLDMFAFEIHPKAWVICAVSLISDVLGILASQGLINENAHGLINSSGTHSAPWSQMNRARQLVGHEAHLAGAAFGSAYYWLMIRPKMIEAQDRRVTEELGNDLTLSGPRNLEQVGSVGSEDLASAASDNSADG
ncbi:hypothetical protein KC363_g1731 [Hortaea werneckii]|nr:hypothetical protein KC361_g2488 [Hortaea werneckii]KAI6880405.1 hypothetical protein KC325_g7263 [Hortaea werneckii]KAI6996900.1 hypothetical protein KC359_g3261 [Hortaea werneckii]KAI7142384.1 hypothetical protein KC344_g7236 [Hortaea werneckii]KAI7177626.1 hypothetical protein KC360_g2211 [Hortaea werneckii]